MSKRRKGKMGVWPTATLPSEQSCFFCFHERPKMTLIFIPDVDCDLCPATVQPHKIREHMPNIQLLCCTRCVPPSEAGIEILKQWVAAEIKLKLGSN